MHAARPNARRHMKRMQTRYQSDSSVPIITVSQVGDHDAEVRPLKREPKDSSMDAMRYLPAELEGNGPEDLEWPSNWKHPDTPAHVQPVTHTSSPLPEDVIRAGAEVYDTDFEDSVPFDIPPLVDVVPKLAKRCRARRVQVVRRSNRSRSLTELPNISPSPSLSSELAQWVGECHLEDAITDSISVASVDSATIGTPPTSGGSSPELAVPGLAILPAFSSMTTEITSGDSSLGVEREWGPWKPGSAGNLPGIPQYQSSTSAASKVLEVAGAKPANAVSNASAMIPSPHVTLEQGKRDLYNEDQSGGPVECQIRPGNKRISGVRHVDAGTSSTHESFVHIPEYPASTPGLHKKSAPSLQSKLEVPPQSAADTLQKRDVERLNGRQLTPQQKRRRAQHRRMQAAYEQEH